MEEDGLGSCVSVEGAGSGVSCLNALDLDVVLIREGRVCLYPRDFLEKLVVRETNGEHLYKKSVGCWFWVAWEQIVVETLLTSAELSTLMWVCSFHHFNCVMYGMVPFVRSAIVKF